MDRNSLAQRFVGNKCLQLSEAPRMERCALRPSSPNPRANVRQILDDNRSLRAFGPRNNPFGETVVDVFGEPIFLTGKHAQSAAAAQIRTPVQVCAKAG
jgi:hypothetical protein